MKYLLALPPMILVLKTINEEPAKTTNVIQTLLINIIVKANKTDKPALKNSGND
jgi:hypothetical protein